MTVPVSLAEGQPADQHIYGRLCVPEGQSPRTLQVLVHGIVYTSHYWDFPDPAGGTDRYNYSAHANDAGFATLAIDRIGSGRSSHPLSLQVTIDSNAWTVHQVIQAVRDGRVRGPDDKRFHKIVYVGHSYGSWVGWNEVSDYNDVDAAVFTAAFGEVAVSALVTALPSLYPAALDPKFLGWIVDPGYLTSLPGTRDEMFYDPAPVDPAVVAEDEATKSTLTATEVADFPRILTEQHNIRVPVFLVAGADDSLFCREYPAAAPALTGGSALGAGLGRLLTHAEDKSSVTGDLTGVNVGATNCSSPEALIADERDHLGPDVPSIDAYILEGAGHDLNQAYDAEKYFAATNEWISRTVGR